MPNRYRRVVGSVVVATALCCAATSIAAQDRPLEPTRSTGRGPDYAPGAPATSQLWQDGDPGQRLHLRGRVLNTAGRPLAGAVIELWQMDGTGRYHDDRYRATLQSSDKGEFAVATVLPGTGFGARHIHVVVTHPAHEPLVTRILFKGDPNLVSGVDDDLAIVVEEVRGKDGTMLLGGVELVLGGGG